MSTDNFLQKTSIVFFDQFLFAGNGLHHCRHLNYERRINGDRWQETGYIFTRDDGRPIRPDSLTGWLADFSKRHGLKHINPYAFRHSAASLMIHNGLDVLTVSGQLGHATPSTTTNIYGHMYESASRVASESIANTILRSNKKPKETGEME